MNEMKQIQVEKVTVNMGAGEVGDEVDKAVNLLEQLTGKEPVKTESSRAAQGFGLRGGLNIGAKATLRGEEAEEFLEYVFEAKGDEISRDVFDTQGNFSVGVEEYIDMPNVSYDPDIGMKGFDVAVTLERPGHRIKRREDDREVGGDHGISEEDARQYVKERFDVELV